jgi:hypothetical protein
MRETPISDPPSPWRRTGSFAIGGLTDVGFGAHSDLLLVISHQGRGVFDCLSGVRVARNNDEGDWQDPVVPFLQSAALTAALKRVGVEAILVSVEGGDHGDFGTPEVSRRVRQFFDKQLLGKDEAISTKPIKAGPAQRPNG